MSAQSFIKELKARGLIFQHTDEDALVKHLDEGMCTYYMGSDPTADSLHVGHIIPLIMMRRFQEHGHRPIVLVGGATGLIGDPSFKDEERSLHDGDKVQEWTANIAKQSAKFVDFDCGENSAVAVNNFDWISKMDVITFLRDVGKHYSINAMINKESVKQRINRPDQGISFTEFSYSLLQGLDFAHLNKAYDCTLQIGGSDQWGNIISGVDLTRRENGNTVHAMTLPLLTDSNGKKIGKSEGNAIWIDADKTSPYTFYQYWLNMADADVDKLLKVYTFVNLDEIAEIVKAHEEEPHLRNGQKRLAEEVTKMIHGEEGLIAAQRISTALFSNQLSTLTAQDLDQLKLDGMPSAVFESSSKSLIDALIEVKLAESKRAAREFIKGNAVSVNGEKVTDLEAELSGSNALQGKYHVLKRGKKAYALAVLEG